MAVSIRNNSADRRWQPVRVLYNQIYPLVRNIVKRNGMVIHLKVFAVLCLCASIAGSAAGQVDDQLTARHRIFAGVGPGLRTVKRGPDGRYYVLASPTVGLAIFDASGSKRELTIGAPGISAGVVTSGGRPVIGFGEDADVDADGKIYVADRELDAVSVFSADGRLLQTIPVKAPTSVAVLPDGEVAVTTLRDPRLVTVFDKHGRDVREFGDPEQLSEREDLNRFLSNGFLISDGPWLYYGFSYLPEPTVRKFDNHGYARTDFQFNSIHAMPEASAIRREIERQEGKGGPPSFKKVLTAFGVDRETGEIWMATHNTLMHFDKDGNRRTTYQIYTPEGARLEANVILVEDERLLIGSDPLGVYEFERPDKKK